MKSFYKSLGVTLLMLISSVMGYANDFPPIDVNQAKERLMKANQSFILKTRKDSKSLANASSTVKTQKQPLKVQARSGATAHIEGAQVYNAAGIYDYWWQFDPTTGVSTKLWSHSYLDSYAPNCGFVRNGLIYAINAEDGYTIVYSLEGQYRGYISMYDYDEMILHSAYDEKNDVVYVYTYDETAQGMLFQKFNPDEQTYEPIRSEVGEGTLADDPLVAMAFNPLDGFIYAITLYQENWIKINPANGEWEIIKKLDFSPSGYVAAMVYVPSSFAFSFVGVAVDDHSYHLVIDPATGDIISNTALTDEAEYAIMYCPDEVLTPGAPLAPEIVSAEFDPASLTGKVKVTAPTQTATGETLTGTLQMVATIDGTEYLTQDVEAGSEVEIAIENQAEGAHTLAVYCTSATGVKGASTEQEFWIGYDAPKAPTNVVLTGNMLTWDPVTEGKYGQQLESDVVTYNVYVAGEKVNAEPITGTSYELIIEVAELTKIKAEVEAVCGSKVSDRTASNEVVMGAYQLPLELDVTKDVTKLFTIVDANSDNTKWGWCSDHNKFEYHYSTSNDADDWAILPATNFSEGMQIYNISVDMASDGSYPERFEVGISKTGKVEDMQIVIPATVIQSSSITTFSNQIKLEEAGNYYIGIHAISDRDNYYLRLLKVAVSMSDAANSVPQTVENIVATAAEYGVLEATVEFTMPTLALNDEALDSEKDITVTLKSNVESVTVTGKPGARVSGIVKTEQGTNTITLTPENEFGAGLESSVSVYTGVDVPLPAVLTSVNVSADNRTVTFSWETSTEGQNGGFVDPAFVTYKILIYYPNQNYWFWYADCEGIEFSYTVQEGTPLERVSLAITSENAAGYIQEGAPIVTASLGTPYEMPLLEAFENQELTYALTIEHPTEDCTGTWEIVDPSGIVAGAANESSTALRAFAQQEGNTSAQLVLPKFNPQSEQEVFVRVRAYLFEEMANAEVFARGYDNIAYSLGTIAMEEGMVEGWHEFEFVLPAEVKNLQWAELVINAKFTSMTESLLIDKYEITTLTGVNSVVTSEASIYAAENAIVIKNVTVGEYVSVFTPAGETIVAEQAQANQMAIEVSTGIYIVRCGNKVQKIIVR